MEKISYAMIGSGWRSEHFLRITRLLSDRLGICGVVARNTERAGYLSEAYGVKCFPTLDALLEKHKPEFVLVCVSKSAVMDVCLDVMRRGIPVLSETPAADNSEQLSEFYRAMPPGASYQCAEQFFLRPDNAARLAFKASGRIGEAYQAKVSTTHGYHAISLMRKLLDINFENAAISAARFSVPGYAGYGRSGMPEREDIQHNEHVIAMFDFGDKSGIYDFEMNQHRSFIRSSQILVKGVKGEINNLDVKYMRDYKSPFKSALTRITMGENDNPGGFGLKGYLCGDEWYYENPFMNARLSDDEISSAACIVKMGEYVRGREPFYSFAQAAQDLYLFEAAELACKSGQPFKTQTQLWADLK